MVIKRELSEVDKTRLMVSVIILIVYIYFSSNCNQELAEKLKKFYREKFPQAMSSKWKFSELYPEVFFDSNEILQFLISFLDQKMFDPLSFDHKKMKNNRIRENGDFTWILPGSILALATPQSNTPFSYTEPTIKGLFLSIIYLIQCFIISMRNQRKFICFLFIFVYL